MATAVEQLVIDPQSRFLEMKSLQPYSSTDEYLYAMKEDLADWLSTMYPEYDSMTADNFIECLENGVLLCQHANNVNEAARKTLSPSSPSLSSLVNCKYRSNVRPGSFNARDNVSQFIRWARKTACVREVLMFESDDLILRKNEKNFILCLLEIARFGAKFGVSVPAIIKLEDEIEKEIERDKQKEKLSTTEIQQQEEYDNHDDYNQINQNLDNVFPLEDVNRTYDLEENVLHTQTFMDTEKNNNNHNHNHKRRQNSEESYDSSTTSSEINTTLIPTNEELQFNRPVEERPKPIIAPASSSHLHKTVCKIANSCCCSQRFPVIRIGEGKYRIGENGTIIFIRILRNHVMVRVGGGWDTLENYLNKHDPCRRSGHHHETKHHNHHENIPILALTNPNVSPSVQKNTPFGKSITIKTEEFPLPKPSNHDTNLVDAQLVITRDAEGRHRIGQITYKAEEDTNNQPTVCPRHHHQHPPSPPTSKIKSVRSSERFTPPPIFNKQSSPSTDQDYSSLTEATPSKPSSTSSLDFKEDFIEQAIHSLDLSSTDKISIESPVHTKASPPPLPVNKSPSTSKNITYKTPRITESIIDSIDGCNTSTHPHDFNISDIDDIMSLTKKSKSNDDTMHMDNDSLESSEGVLEEKKKRTPPISYNSPSIKKPTTQHSAFYLAQKQKFQQEQAANRQRSASSLNRNSTRSNTLPNVVEALKKEEQLSKQRHKPTVITKRTQSSEIIEKLNDSSRLDRDSGFDEQDFRRERLQSNGDDNSSISSIKSPKIPATARSLNLDYKENKAYELRMKKLDPKRNTNDKESPVKSARNSAPSTRRTSDAILPNPPINRNRKSSLPKTPVKQQKPKDEEISVIF